MKANFAILSRGYPLQAEYKREELYDHLGWPDLKKKAAFQDTCAIRMSVALAAANVMIPGRLVIKAGTLKGKPVEPGQAKLSQIFKNLWGQPEVFKSKEDARHRIGNRSGVISFFRIEGPNGSAQGHIDLVRSDGHDFHACAMSCYFQSAEIWFWPLL